ncbi:YraN family protein [bacterium]|nr:YraN family protein [bacterium]MBU3955808.1 YraN family protein [bacterium]
MVSEKRISGNLAEDKACSFLEEQGFKIICRNFAVRLGEIDIIAADGEELCFIEVKSSKGGFLPPELKVNKIKQRKIIKTASIYMGKEGKSFNSFRFDVIAFDRGEIRYYRDAFTADI